MPNQPNNRTESVRNPAEDYATYLARYNRAAAELNGADDLSGISEAKREAMTLALMQINEAEAAEAEEAKKTVLAVRANLVARGVEITHAAQNKIKALRRAADQLPDTLAANPKLFDGRTSVDTIATMMISKVADDDLAGARSKPQDKPADEVEVLIDAAGTRIKFKVAGVEYPTLLDAIEATMRRGESQ